MMRLALHPRPQPALQRAVARFERPGGQRPGVGDGQHTGLAVRHGDQDRDEIGGNREFASRRIGHVGSALMP